METRRQFLYGWLREHSKPIGLATVIGLVLLAAYFTVGSPALRRMGPPPAPDAVVFETPSPIIQPPMVRSGTSPSTPTLLVPSFASGVKVLASVPISTPLGYYSGQDLHPMDWSPDGKTFAYGSGDGLWIAREPTYRAVRLLSIPMARVGGVYWSPDGQHLALHGDEWVERDSLWGDFLWVVEVDGTDLKNVTPNTVVDPYRLKYINQWLDSQVLTFNAWLGGGVSALFQVDTVSGRVTRLLGSQEMVQGQAIGGEYYWSPGHKYFAIQDCCFTHIAIADVGSPIDRKWLSNHAEPPYENFQGWMPNGYEFFYLRWERKGIYGEYDPSLSLWRWDVMRREGRKVLDYVYQAALSPDGSRLAFLRQENRLWQPPGEALSQASGSSRLSALTLGVQDLATGEVKLYGPAGYRASGTLGIGYWEAARPLWSPDGKLLAYWGEDGNAWLVAVDSERKQHLTQGLQIVQMMWSLDASKLAFRSFDQAWIVEIVSP